jgi:hypothetical protein
MLALTNLLKYTSETSNVNQSQAQKFSDSTH